MSRPDHFFLAATLRGFNNYVYAVAFGDNDRILAAASADMTIRIWDTTNPEHPTALGAPLSGPASSVNSVAIDPSGQLLAGAAGDGTVWLWDITKPAHPRYFATWSALPGQIFVDAFSPNSRTLAAAGEGRVVSLWDTDPRRVATQICATTGDSVTRAEWSVYVPGRRYAPPCRGSGA